MTEESKTGAATKVVGIAAASGGVVAAVMLNLKGDQIRALQDWLQNLATWEVALLLGTIPVLWLGFALLRRIAVEIDALLDGPVKRLFGRFPYNYLKSLHAGIQKLGARDPLSAVPLNLEDIFVPRELVVTGTTPERFRAELWRGKNQSWKIEEILASKDNNFRCVALLGVPGSGKKTLVAYIVALLTRPWPRPFGSLRSDLIPIHIRLSEYEEDILVGKSTLLDIARRIVETRCRSSVPHDWPEHFVDNGRLLFLLDGLEDIGDFERKKHVFRWVARQSGTLSTCRFVITCRADTFWAMPENSLTPLAIEPLSDGQLRSLVKRTLASSLEKQKVVRQSGGYPISASFGEHLADTLLNHPDVFIVKTPLTMAHIVSIALGESWLPTARRGELYRKLYESIVRQYASGHSHLHGRSLAELQGCLERLAYQLTETKRIDFQQSVALSAIRKTLKSADDSIALSLWQILLSRDLLFCQDTKGRYRFSYRTFQEQLTALYLVKNGKTRAVLEKCAEDPVWWGEVLRHYLSVADVRDVLRECLGLETRISDVVLLVVTHLWDCNEPETDALRELDAAFKHVFARCDTRSALQLAERVLELRLASGELASSRVRAHSDRLTLTNVDYGLFLYELPPHLRARHLPRSWSSDDLADAFVAPLTPVYGITGTDAIECCRWLNSKFSSLAFRLPSFDELENDVYGVQSDAPAGSTTLRATGQRISFWCANGRLGIFGEQRDRLCRSMQNSLKSYGGIETAQLDASSCFGLEHILLTLLDYDASVLVDATFDVAEMTPLYCATVDFVESGCASPESEELCDVGAALTKVKGLSLAPLQRQLVNCLDLVNSLSTVLESSAKAAYPLALVPYRDSPLMRRFFADVRQGRGRVDFLMDELMRQLEQTTDMVQSENDAYVRLQFDTVGRLAERLAELLRLSDAGAFRDIETCLRTAAQFGSIAANCIARSLQDQLPGDLTLRRLADLTVDQLVSRVSAVSEACVMPGMLVAPLLALSSSPRAKVRRGAFAPTKRALLDFERCGRAPGLQELLLDAFASVEMWELVELQQIHPTGAMQVVIDAVQAPQSRASTNLRETRRRRRWGQRSDTSDVSEKYQELQ